MINNTKDEIEARSEPVQDIISYIPSRILRWGNAILLFILIMFVFLMYFIRYPTVLESNIVITTSLPPVKIMSRSSGKITHILVRDNQRVKKGEVIAIIENTADYKHVQALKDYLEKFSKMQFSDQQNVPLLTKQINNLQLGVIQTEFSLFEYTLEQLLHELSLNPQYRETESIHKQLSEYNILAEKQRAQLNLYKQELAIAKKDFERHEHLFKENLISTSEYEQHFKSFLQVQRNHESFKIVSSQTRIAINDLNKQLLLLDIKNNQTIFNLKTALKEQIQKLNVSLISWEQAYLLKTPIEGLVTFLTFYSNNQYVKQGEETFSVVPINQKGIVGKITLPILNSGKVKVGQRVDICLDNYPCEEWGRIQGKIKNMSLVPQNGLYTLEVELVDGLQTSYHKQLAFKQQMQGRADIITEKRRLIERIYTRLRKEYHY